MKNFTMMFVGGLAVIFVVESITIVRQGKFISILTRVILNDIKKNHENGNESG